MVLLVLVGFIVVGLILFAIPNVGPVLGVAFWVGGIWLTIRVGKTANARKAAEVAEQATPVPVDGVPELLSSRGRQKVVGEQFRSHALKAAIAGRRIGTPGKWETALRAPAYLITEPENRRDPRAVAVCLAVDGGALKVGYLPREDAARYQPLLAHLTAQGRVASCGAGIVQGRHGPQVFLYLAAPDECVFRNRTPRATRLAAERSCALSGEGQYQDVIARYEGGSGLAWATLHPAKVERGKSAGKPTVEARFDGEPVGVMTAAQGQRYGQVLTWAGGVAAEAQVYKGSRGLEVRVFLPKVD